MHETIERFRDHYADKIAFGMSEFLRNHGEIVVSRLLKSVSHPRSTIYLFGNGGSHAIGKCVEYALQAHASSRGLRIRVQTGVDVHKATLPVIDDNVGTSFVEVLKTEGADSND